MLRQTAAQPGQHMGRGWPSTTTTSSPPAGSGRPQWKHWLSAASADAAPVTGGALTRTAGAPAVQSASRMT